MSTVHRPYRITVLSPVHIGTGRELVQGLDFFVGPGRRINVVDFDAVVAQCAKRDVDLSPYIAEGSLEKLFTREPQPAPEPASQEVDPRLAPLLKLRQATASPTPPLPGGKGPRMDLSSVTAYRAHLACVHRPDRIREHIRDVAQRLYLPGTSLKGAIRTALCGWLLEHNEEARRGSEEALRKQRDRPSRERADDVMQKILMGDDPNHDLGRIVQVGDTTSTAETKVVETLIADVHANGRIAWKNLSTRRLEFRPDRATSLFCEALDVGTELEMDLRVDTWLFGQPKLGFGWGGRREAVSDLEGVCRAYARAVAEHERDFFERHGLREPARFYRNAVFPLLGRESGFPLQVGWGTGWYDKTVADAFGDELVQDLRGWFSLGKRVHRDCGGDVQSSRRVRGRYFCFRCRRDDITREGVVYSDVFPKTRKVVFENGEPRYPLGWVYVRREAGD